MQIAQDSFACEILLQLLSYSVENINLYKQWHKMAKFALKNLFSCFTVKLKVLRLWYVTKLDINFGVLQLLTPNLELYDH